MAGYYARDVAQTPARQEAVQLGADSAVNQLCTFQQARGWLLYCRLIAVLLPSQANSGLFPFVLAQNRRWEEMKGINPSDAAGSGRNEEDRVENPSNIYQSVQMRGRSAPDFSKRRQMTGMRGRGPSPHRTTAGRKSRGCGSFFTAESVP